MRSVVSTVQRHFSNRGFTLVELALVFSLFTILFAVAVTTYSNHREDVIIEGAVEAVRFELELAHSDALAGKGGVAQSVRFSSSTYTRFPGDTYDPMDPDNVTNSVDGSLRISTTLPGDEVVTFDRLTGATGLTATVTIAVADDANVYEQLVIGSRGDITLVQ